MAKINLLKQEWVGKSQIKKLKMAARVILILTVSGFLLQTFYITGRLVYLRNKINNTQDEIKTLNSVFSTNKNLTENYVWAQGMLEILESERNKEYKYKDYLVEINSWLNEGTSLVGVSFTERDEITFLVYADGIDDYRAFETNLNLRQLDENFGFTVVEQDSLSRIEDGTYKVKIKLKV